MSWDTSWRSSGTSAIESRGLRHGESRIDSRGRAASSAKRTSAKSHKASLFYHSSVGCVFGVRLRNGREVVIKAYRGRWSTSFLTDVQRAQEQLSRSGFPCPIPVRPPRPIGNVAGSSAIVESYLADPGMSARSDSKARAVSANGLARQIKSCRDLVLPRLMNHPLRQTGDGLYPEPHSPLFDFAATSEGAGWIDAFAAGARSQRDEDTGDMVSAHCDWSARNVRLDDTGLLAVYDWDSLALVPESTAVGQAAVTWSVTAEPDGFEFPPASEVAAFFRDYEHSSGRQMTDAERRAAAGAAVCTLAYIARCEHSSEMTGTARPDQIGARDRLASDGDRILGLFSTRT